MRYDEDSEYRLLDRFDHLALSGSRTTVLPTSTRQSQAARKMLPRQTGGLAYTRGLYSPEEDTEQVQVLYGERILVVCCNPWIFVLGIPCSAGVKRDLQRLDSSAQPTRLKPFLKNFMVLLP